MHPTALLPNCCYYPPFNIREIRGFWWFTFLLATQLVSGRNDPAQICQNLKPRHLTTMCVASLIITSSHSLQHRVDVFVSVLLKENLRPKLSCTYCTPESRCESWSVWCQSAGSFCDSSRTLMPRATLLKMAWTQPQRCLELARNADSCPRPTESETLALKSSHLCLSMSARCLRCMLTFDKHCWEISFCQVILQVSGIPHTWTAPFGTLWYSCFKQCGVLRNSPFFCQVSWFLFIVSFLQSSPNMARAIFLLLNFSYSHSKITNPFVILRKSHFKTILEICIGTWDVHFFTQYTVIKNNKHRILLKIQILWHRMEKMFFMISEVGHFGVVGAIVQLDSK